HGIECALVPIVAPGDRDRRSPLYAVEDASPGLFTKHLEDALLDGRIDLAVHSLKDLPTVQPEELTVARIPQREASEDCLRVNPRAQAHGEAAGGAAVARRLARSARVGTCSLRREAELLAVRPDLAIEPVRGDVPSRVEKVERGELDAVVFAEAGLRRLALS